MLRRPSVENTDVNSGENNNIDSIEKKTSSEQEIEKKTHDNNNPKTKAKNSSPQNEISKSEKSELIKPTRTYVQSSSSSSARTITRTYEPLSIFNLKSLQLNTTDVDIEIEIDNKYSDEKCSDVNDNNSRQSTSHNRSISYDECGDDSGSNESKQSDSELLTISTRNSTNINANTNGNHEYERDRTDKKTIRSNGINNTNVSKNNTTHGSENNERNEIIDDEDDDRQLTIQEHEAIAHKVMSSHTFTASRFFLYFLLCLPTAIM